MIIQPVILCGGSGTRLWPLSREQYPKQLLRLVGEQTMLQATAARLRADSEPIPGRLIDPILVGNEEYRFLMAEQLRQAGVRPAKLILEPCGRNTAPALSLAAHLALNIDAGRDPVLVVMPADQVIENEDAFRVAVALAASLAENGGLVTFGIKPTAPETGYGYIKAGKRQCDGAYEVDRFVEKPDLETAESYLASGDYLWNSGIFVMKASVWLANIQRFRPEIASACRNAYEASLADQDFLRPEKTAFSACPSDSIDYAVMEPLTDPEGERGAVMVVPLEARWSDVGAWSALWEIGAKDAEGNVLLGDVVAVGSEDSLVLAEGRLVACVGLRDIVVVETADAVLVADRKQIQKVKDVVASLKASQRSESYSHRKVFRPWGWYDSIDFGDRFQVKRIVVNPGAALSLQMHHHRAEHWIVVSGTARVTKGEESFLVSENQSTYIPLGTVHRLENPGKLPLEMIEVQSGSYLGEDDIVRFEDVYGR